MASSVGDLGRELGNRAKTVVRDDWNGVKRRVGMVAKEEYGYRGSFKGRTKARKASKRSGR